MDERLRYEQLIGGKLQNLPVPDMQDVIWARIKTQLDLDMPADEGDGGNPPPSPSAPRAISRVLPVVVIALITIFLLTKKKPAQKNNSQQPTTIEQTVSPGVQNNSPPLQKDNTINKTRPAGAGAKNSFDDVAGDAAVQNNPVNTVPIIDDSSGTNFSPPSLTLISPPLPDTNTVIKKKGKGMTGLSDSSYRIVPKNKD